MIVRLLVPTDFSAESDNSLAYAVALACQHNAKITLLHVCRTGLFSIGKSKEKEVAALSKMQKIMDQHATTTLQDGEILQMDAKVTHGRTADEIIRFAVKSKISFVIMGFKGEGLSPNSTLGHNTLEVILRSPIPVISIPENVQYTELKSIAYTNHNARTENTNFNTVVKLAETYGADLIIIRTRSKKQEDPDTSRNVFSHKKNIFKYQNISKFYASSDDLAESMSEFVQLNKPNLIALGIHEEQFFNKMVRQLYGQEISPKYPIPLLSISIM